MNSYLKRVCEDCEFYESKHDRSNTGDCMLDIHGDHGIKTVKSSDTCEFWMGSTVDEAELHQ